jgi:hypothetical protein
MRPPPYARDLVLVGAVSLAVLAVLLGAAGFWAPIV